MWNFITMLFNYFIGWAKTNKRYPLILPFLIFFIYLFVFNYFQTETFKETLHHDYFLIISGIVLGITGILYACLDFKKRIIARYSVGSIFIILGFTFISLGFFQRISPPLPDDKLVISVAEFDFEPNTKASKNDSISIQKFICDELRKKALNGVPIAVKEPRYIVRFGNQLREGEAQAKKLGTSRKGAAHIVVWGQLGRYGKNDNDEALWVRPIFTVCQPFRNMQVKGIDLRALYDEPLAFPKLYVPQIADALTILSGLAFFANGLHEEAITSFYNSGWMMTDLTSCIEAMKNINSDNLKHKMVIYNTFGMVYQRLMRYSTAKLFFLQVTEIDNGNYAALNNLALCDMALKNYNKALQAFNKLLEQRTNPVVLSNLAFCEFELGNTVQAIEHWEESLKQFLHLPELPMKKYDILDAKSGLALGYFDLGKVDQAVSLFQEVLNENNAYGKPEALKAYLWPDKAIATMEKLSQNIN